MTQLPMPPPFEPDQVIVIDYTNWRGERSLRRITPVRIEWGSSEWHPRPQWLLIARDVDRGVLRSFALLDIHATKPDEAGPAT